MPQALSPRGETKYQPMGNQVTATVIIRVAGTQYEIGHMMLDGDTDWQAVIARNLRQLAAEFDRLQHDSKETDRD